MITLQYFNGDEWIDAGDFATELMAWISLGGDDLNYRTVDSNGNILTDKSINKMP